jgi:hypothetical protein
MNKLLSILEKDNRLSIDSLRRLYRALAVRCHPDVTKGSGADFIRLQSEYDEALKYLAVHKFTQGSRIETSSGRSQDARTEFLRVLYLHTVTYDGKGWKQLVPKLIRLAADYRKDVGVLVANYKRAFLDPSSGGSHRTFIAETHKILLDSIHQLAWCFEKNLAQNKRLLMSNLRELTMRARDLDQEMGSALLGMCDLLKNESNGKPVSIMTIGTTEKQSRSR